MNRIFISSPHSEQRLAQELAMRLHNEGLSTIVDSFESQLADEWLHHVLYSVESSDVVLLLIPDDDYERKWVRREFNKNLRHKLKSRNILVIQVYLGRKKFFTVSNDQIAFSLEKDDYRHSQSLYTDKSISKLVTYLANLPKVNFEFISPFDFEELIVALLKKLRFFDIEHQNKNRDFGFDILAKTKVRNPFGGVGQISWAIEIKYHKNSRADISSLHQLSYYLEDQPIDVNGVLITNGQLTSTAQEWLEHNEQKKRTSITIVDGIKLKQLILKYPVLVDEFFGRRGDL
ncbi:restriction endonuclease [Desulfoluna spongiiphila]|uniref:restriction endonuclease n=1 Tax=Desulfoluna spongiiphila TaxID=419481 RepID=UPI00125C36A3|nr:restriction endonuclease [Desulfoluna spongiiphila]VVS94666.1 restriction endonuclease type iv mrr [Desulfoluna spongiiphila]